jgi:transposase
MSGLISNPAAIWLAVSPVDMRRGIDGLSMVVQQALGHAPCSGSAFVFRNRSGNRIKVVVWDGTGVWLCQRRLHEGRFIWPKVTDPCFSVTFEQWQWLIAGVDWQRLSAIPCAHWQV